MNGDRPEPVVVAPPVVPEDLLEDLLNRVKSTLPSTEGMATSKQLAESLQGVYETLEELEQRHRTLHDQLTHEQSSRQALGATLATAAFMGTDDVDGDSDGLGDTYERDAKEGSQDPTGSKGGQVGGAEGGDEAASEGPAAASSVSSAGESSSDDITGRVLDADIQAALAAAAPPVAHGSSAGRTTEGNALCRCLQQLTDAIEAVAPGESLAESSHWVPKTLPGVAEQSALPVDGEPLPPHIRNRLHSLSAGATKVVSMIENGECVVPCRLSWRPFVLLVCLLACLLFFRSPLQVARRAINSCTQS